jgi:hypothetical protein
MVLKRMSFWRNVSPRGAMSDLLKEWRQPTPYRWQILGVSVAATFAMMMLFLPENERAPPAKPTVTWITTFEPGRTDEEIAESNRANQVRQDAIRAAEEARAERRREFYRAIGRASGFDMEELEREFSDEPEKPARPAAAPTQNTGE